MTLVEQRRKTAPPRNFSKGIGAEDEEKLRRAPSLGVQRPDGVLGVRPTLPNQLHVGDAIVRSIRQRQRYERESLVVAAKRIVCAKRLVVRRDEQNRFELQCRTCGIRRIEMTEMNRIECTAKKSQTLLRLHASRRLGFIPTSQSLSAASFSG